jgi:hypothetical protein
LKVIIVMHKILCLECNKEFYKAGFKNHLLKTHNIKFIEYLEKHNIKVYYKNNIIPSYYCNNCKDSLDR